MKNPLLLSLILFLPIGTIAQHSVEFTAAVGATVIDIEELVAIDEIDRTIAEDWETFSWGLSAQYVYPVSGNIGIGGELMYQQLYWYSVSVPYVTSRIYREYNVTCVRLTPLLRIGVNSNFAFDLGPELNFMDGTSVGLMLSGNYYIPVSENIDVPVKARIDYFKNIVATIPISLNVGVRIRI